MISKEEVLRIAKLARLELTENEVEKMQKDLSEILDYFNLLKKVPAKNLKAQKTEARAENLRKDEVVSENLRDKLVAGAPDKKDDYIKVKTVF